VSICLRPLFMRQPYAPHPSLRSLQAILVPDATHIARTTVIEHMSPRVAHPERLPALSVPALRLLRQPRALTATGSPQRFTRNEASMALTGHIPIPSVFRNRTRCPSVRATQRFVVCVTIRPFGGSGPLGPGPSPCAGLAAGLVLGVAPYPVREPHSARE
jgi:hypothetical protein